MSRINTNVSSLVAQNTLNRSNADLQQALRRLSTGLKINTGKDDPAGLIASENLRRDITAIDKAISNSERASQVIATADSALGQVSKLLNDVRGLVTEAANTGALSDEQIAANQLQVDSSLEAIDRIAQTTAFQGRKLLDGSLDFIFSEGTGYSSVSSVQINKANLGATGSMEVNVDITTAATKAQITNAIPSTATGQFTLDGQHVHDSIRRPPRISTRVTVAIDKNAGPEAHRNVHDRRPHDSTSRPPRASDRQRTGRYHPRQCQPLCHAARWRLDQTDLHARSGRGLDGQQRHRCRREDAPWAPRPIPITSW